jgi:hypothetical protein
MVRFVKLLSMFYRYDSLRKSIVKAWVCRKITFFDKPTINSEEEIYKP